MLLSGIKRLPFRWQMKKESFSICHRKWEFFMIIVLLSSAFRLGCFPISCSAFRASRICFFCSAFYISGFFRGAFCICVLCFGCGTFFYSAFFYSAFFSCSCFDYAFDSGFCFCRRLCLGSIVAVNCKSNRKYDYCKYEITADAKELFRFFSFSRRSLRCAFSCL